MDLCGEGRADKRERLDRRDKFLLTTIFYNMKFVCNICGYVYDPAVGDPDSGIAPGTPFEDIPADWVCPVCGVGKEDFSRAE